MEFVQNRFKPLKLFQNIPNFYFNEEVVFLNDVYSHYETFEMKPYFENSLKLVKECDLTWLHVFPYSNRKGTPAARMPQVASHETKSRAAALRKTGRLQVAKHLKAQVGRSHAILMENPNMGRTEQFSEVIFEQPQKESTIVMAQITSWRATHLTA